MRTKDKLTIKDLEKYGLKLPDKDTCSCTRCKLHNKTLDEIGNIDIDEAFKKWAEKNGYIKREDMELDVEKAKEFFNDRLVRVFDPTDAEYKNVRLTGG